MIGDHEGAIALLQHSLSVPAGLTVNELRLDPTWDRLRDNPHFQKLMGEEPSDGG